MNINEQVRILKELGIEISAEIVERILEYDKEIPFEDCKLENTQPFTQLLDSLGYGEFDASSGTFKSRSDQILTFETEFDDMGDLCKQVLLGVERIMQQDVKITNIEVVKGYNEVEDEDYFDLRFELNAKKHSVKIQDIYEGWVSDELLNTVFNEFREVITNKHFYDISIGASAALMYRTEEYMKSFSDKTGIECTLVI